MTERIEVQRKMMSLLGDSVEFIKPQRFKVGDILHGEFPHQGKDKWHLGNLKVTRVVDSLGMKALAKCTQAGCAVSIEVIAVAPKTEG